MVPDGTLFDLWSNKRFKIMIFLVRDLSSENEFVERFLTYRGTVSNTSTQNCRRQGIRFCHSIGAITIIYMVILAELISLVTLQQK